MTKMKKTITLIIMFITFMYVVKAQDSLQASKVQNSLHNSKPIEKAIIKDIRGLKLSSPFGASTLSNFISNVSISSFFKEGVNGKLELQGKFSERMSGGLSVDQKIGKSSTEATPLDITGISPGTTVKFNLQKMIWNPSFDKLTDKQVAQIQKLTAKYATDNHIQDPRTVGLKDIYENGTAEEKQNALDVFRGVNTTPVTINFEMGFTKTSFSYATDSVSLAETKESFLTPTVSLSVVKMLSNQFGITGYVSLSYNYSESYTAADDINFSIPFGTTRNYYTNTVAFGKPTKKTSHNVIAEFRNNIFSKGNNSLAVSPSVSLGINSKKLSLFLPVYFIKGADENGKLNNSFQGGVRFGYTTSTESGKVSSFKQGFIAQLIISKPLDFLSKF